MNGRTLWLPSEKALFDEWLADLETTDALQGYNKLGDAEQGFCCLGRLCVVEGVPFNSEDGTPPSNTFAGSVYDKISIMLSDADMDGVVTMNDFRRFTFPQIADRLRQAEALYHQLRLP